METRGLFLTLFALFILIADQVSGQTATAVADTIDNQFVEMIKTSPSYKDNKVVKNSKIAELRKNTHQQIRGLEKKISQLNDSIYKQNKCLFGYKNDIKRANEELNEIKQSKNKLSLFGIMISKSLYQTVILVVFIVLLLLLIIFIYKFKSNYKHTAEAHQKLKETNREYDEYRQKALQTQQKLGRQLQDERNKNSQNSSTDK